MNPMERAILKFKAMRAAFLACGTEGLTVRQMFNLPDGDPVGPRQHVMVKRMFDTGHLERLAERGPHDQYLHRLTAKGWRLFEQYDAGQVGDEFIYRVLARSAHEVNCGVRLGSGKATSSPVAKSKTGCGLCGRSIVDRKVNATKCWSCEQVGRRIAHGGDHFPRSQAYYDLIGPTRAKKERKRLRDKGTHQPESLVDGTAQLRVVEVPNPFLRRELFTRFASQYAGLMGDLASEVQRALGQLEIYIVGEMSRRAPSSPVESPNQDLLDKIKALLKGGV